MRSVRPHPASSEHAFSSSFEDRAVIRSLLETAGECIKVLDLDARLQLMNASGQCLMEIDDFASFVGRDWLDFWAGEDRTRAEAAVKSARTGDSSRFQGFCPTAKGTPKIVGRGRPPPAR